MTPPRMDGPIIELCDVADKYTADIRAKAKRLKDALAASARAEDLRGAATIIEQLSRVLRATSALHSELVGDMFKEDQNDENSPQLAL